MNFSGFWQGRWTRADVSLSLAVWLVGESGLAIARTTAKDGSWRILGGKGEISEGKLRLELQSADAGSQHLEEEGEPTPPLVIALSLQGPDYGICRIEWKGSASDEFAVQRQWDPPSSDLLEPSNFTLSTQEKATKIPASALDLATLRKIYNSLELAAAEAAEREASMRSRGLPPESQAQEQEHLRRLYQVAVTARGADGDQVVAFSADLLTQEKLPEPLASVVFETGVYYRLVNQREPNNRAQVRLDFSRPPLFDLSNATGNETPNDSSIRVTGNLPFWVEGTYEKVHSILRRRRVRTGWIHWRHTFDVLVLLLGLPLALPVAALVVEFLAGPTMGTSRWFSLALFLLLVPAVMLLFRLAFGFARWLLPYAEFSVAPAPLHRRLRLILASLIIGVLASLVATAVWALLR